MYPIATINASGSTSSVTFSSIPQTFTHLQLRGTAQSTGGGNTYCVLSFNGDTTSSHYNDHYLTGTGSTVVSGADVGTVPGMAYNNITYTTSFGAQITDLLDYTNTNKYKTMRSITGYDANGSGQVNLHSGLWLSTSAITSLTLSVASGNFASGSTFQLYGIKTA
jgi:hypothetical protein